jgi:hypothetical protein
MENTALEVAFLATTYRVVTPSATFNLRIGQSDPAFELFLRKWGIVTACNPGGNLVPDAKANAAATKELATKIRAHGWLAFPSINHADAGDWPDEPGYCVLNAGEEALCELARELGQAAVVFAEIGDCRGGAGRYGITSGRDRKRHSLAFALKRAEFNGDRMRSYRAKPTPPLMMRANTEWNKGARRELIELLLGI